MKSIALIAFVTVLAASLPASAHEVIYRGIFQDETGTGSLGTGSATLTFDLDLATMRVEFTFSGLTGNTTAAHLHCCTALPNAGNAGVATVTPSFAFPLGVKAGSFDQTFDLLPLVPTTTYNAAFITANGGTANSALVALLAGLDADKAYLNIHTSTAPAGEIRALLHVAPVPMPAAVWLFGSALAGLMGWRRHATLASA